jgi:hypothetical protein
MPLCERVGLTAADLDVTELTGEVHGVGAGLEGNGSLIESAVGEAREVRAQGEDPMIGDRLDPGHAREAVVRL